MRFATFPQLDILAPGLLEQDCRPSCLVFHPGECHEQTLLPTAL